jgi:hypothetical protein
MPIYVATDVTLAEVTPLRGEETLGHDVYGDVSRHLGLRVELESIGHIRTERRVKPKGVMGACW